MMTEIKAKIVNLKGNATYAETLQVADILEALVKEVEQIRAVLVKHPQQGSVDAGLDAPEGRPNPPAQSKDKLPQLPVQFPTTPAS